MTNLRRRVGARMLALLALLPVWIAVCALVNLLGELFDRIDRTGLFYGNVLVVATRRNAGAS